MKIFVLILIYPVSTFIGTSQDSTISLSKFEIFSAQHGKTLKTESKQTGSIGPWVVTKLRTTDISTGNNVYAINIGYKNSNIIAAIVNPNTLYIDLDELDSVINALNYFIKKENSEKPVNDQNYRYVTSADVEVSCYYFKDSDGWWFGIDKLYQELGTPIPGSLITFNKKRITELTNLLAVAGKIIW